MIYRRESVDEAWAGITLLLKAYAEEVGVFGAKGLSPDIGWYESLEQAGGLRTFVMRADDGVLCGFSAFYMTRHPHYDRQVAIQDVLYVDPNYRGPAAVKFLVWVDSELKKDGAQNVIRQVTSKLDYSALLQNMGYEAMETSFIREL